MYQIDPTRKANAEIHRLLNNALVWSLVDREGRLLKSACYEYQLTIVKRCNRGSRIIRTRDLLIEVRQ